ncbi:MULTISPECIES: methoxy mycolic acid synthase MmaA3 [Mycobacterium ulcerans group]|uniref:Methoxy mycolic acid synthase 3, MmaA3 n=2 Tax=Mycobacterium ulcerans group TaxID=2993898 RepID=B2HSH6_MYCMM|nr:MULTISPECIES: methoxy mycolic acid synthase MmaA3 [Mycobacterium ulcerans group]ULL09589.1 class I SAM-dependent methyltransferase [Mycobacterium liflandii]ACC39434.1 methoxy mycolic acid synthase 3, MmaA3 [Mycobacterium marinum M]AGC61109.1 methoxy mycolic acid synthase 3, MmaA3 [Mycobacterium liflandii 128FXT]EPQ73687.1 Cyclopropane-fatty-acyl-phospholipid synthase [Mycobacterium marinum MB2]MDC8974605.1 methoxy mycolic acid synthase MmaA3 [Mycobacterium marinum]
MSGKAVAASRKRSNLDDVQAHYDLSNEFFALFVDPTRTYSCAYFPREDMTLQEAQIAKIDLTLDKLGLTPGMTLLDIGCGWGSVLKRAVEKYDVNVVGLTLSKNQHAYCQQVLDEVDTNRSHRVLLRDWAEFDEPVDRIVTIEALEHFGFHRYDDFFKFTYEALPADGVMLLHAITGLHPKQVMERGIPLTMEMAKFIRFIVTDIFPGGRLPMIETVEEHADKVGFKVARRQSLQLDFAKTLDFWAEALEERRDEAIKIQSEEVYERYMKYLTGCARAFRIGYIDCNQFTLAK